jgi:hypothetical protein
MLKEKDEYAQPEVRLWLACTMLAGLTRNHRFGGGEGQAGKLGRDRQSGDRKSGRASIETLETSGATDSERRFAKVMSGGSVRALPRCSEKSPKELKA